jgi:hypothetical protein
MKEVIIIIPLHTARLQPEEQQSLARCMEVLGKYPVCIVKPENTDMSALSETYPGLLFESFADNYFTNIQAYNRLMLSAAFYERFAGYNYMLIYQADAWVFGDELGYWISQGYDYVGAPWIIKPKHQRWHYRFYSLLMSRILGKTLKSSKMAGKSGNGGLSLRRIPAFIQVCESKKDLIDQYLLKSAVSDLYHEDVFWATENPEFSYPGYTEALRFAWDQHPGIAVLQAGGVLPFGCHGWFKTPELRQFWKQYIP